jgi:hypothetical protein
MRREHNRLTRELDDRRQFLQRIDVHLVDVRVAADDIARNQDRVAIRRAFRRGLDANVAVGAGPILDDDLLLQAARQVLTDEAGAHVGGAAGRERHDEAKQPARPFLRVYGRGHDDDEREQANAQLQHWKIAPRSTET